MGNAPVLILLNIIFFIMYYVYPMRIGEGELCILIPECHEKLFVINMVIDDYVLSSKRLHVKDMQLNLIDNKKLYLSWYNVIL